MDPTNHPPLSRTMSTTETTTIRYEFKVLDENGLIEASGDAATREEVEREGRHHLARYQKYGPCTLDLRMVAVPVAGPVPAPAVAEAPLWRVLQDAYSVTQQPDIFSEENERLTIAAEIRAVRDWLVPEDGPRPGISWPMERAAWDARQSIRATLTTEADRAERGE